MATGAHINGGRNWGNNGGIGGNGCNSKHSDSTSTLAGSRGTVAQLVLVVCQCFQQYNEAISILLLL